MNCIFCRIASGEEATRFVYETSNVVVINDIHPKAPIHLLVIPKKHIKEFTEIFDGDQNIWDEMIEVIKKMIKQFDLPNKGYRIITNGGGAQLVDHFHVHIMGAIKPDRGL